MLTTSRPSCAGNGTDTSHGRSVRVARGLYYRPSTFRSRVIEKEETVHQDTRLLGFTTKHIYFSGPKKKFRVRDDKIVDFEPYGDGFAVMKDTQTARPQVFRTGEVSMAPRYWPTGAA